MVSNLWICFHKKTSRVCTQRVSYLHKQGEFSSSLLFSPSIWVLTSLAAPIYVSNFIAFLRSHWCKMMSFRYQSKDTLKILSHCLINGQTRQMLWLVKKNRHTDRLGILKWIGKEGEIVPALAELLLDRIAFSSLYVEIIWGAVIFLPYTEVWNDFCKVRTT